MRGPVHNSHASTSELFINDIGPDSIPVLDEGPIAVSFGGFFLGDSSSLRLCDSLAESFPPQPAGPALTEKDVLEEGTMFPPTNQGQATLQRGADWVQVQINTSGLPEGAYSVWWIIFNNPDECFDIILQEI